MRSSEGFSGNEVMMGLLKPLDCFRIDNLINENVAFESVLFEVQKPSVSLLNVR
jgi:hypothetical protein